MLHSDHTSKLALPPSLPTQGFTKYSPLPLDKGIPPKNSLAGHLWLWGGPGSGIL